VEAKSADALPAETKPASREPRAFAQQVTVATAAAEQLQLPAAKANGMDRSGSQDIAQHGTTARDTARTAPAPPDNPDLLVAVLMARPETKSVADLAGKTIAIDERYAKSSSTVRTAIVAAGATEVQLSEGTTTAINRLTNGEVPAAVVALVSPDATETFPDIKGFKIFHVPLSPRAARAR
jgi:ribosomal protein L19